MVIDPEAIDSSFKSRATDLIARLKATRPVDRESEGSTVRLPGEQSSARAKRCMDKNEIEIDAALYQHLVQLAQ